MAEISNLQEVRLRKERQASDFIQAWPVFDLTPKHSSDWLEKLIENNPQRGLVISIWAHYPNLRTATQKLSHFLTPNWPSDSDTSALYKAIDVATTNVSAAVDQGDQFSGRIIALYLHGLASISKDVARIEIYGEDNKGVDHLWDYFSCPLQEWAKKHKMKEIELHAAREKISDEEILGLRQHLVASICNPRETGFFAAYAPPIRL